MDRKMLYDNTFGYNGTERDISEMSHEIVLRCAMLPKSDNSPHLLKWVTVGNRQ